MFQKDIYHDDCGLPVVFTFIRKISITSPSFTCVLSKCIFTVLANSALDELCFVFNL